ncbi:MAG: hypothetical protein DMG13_33705 [Acidobacteria bacterium]|nr:MAG: hypothetical protein DMG13_33705 [Acidobacteriota bacterium]
MRDRTILLVHVVTTALRVVRPRVRAVVAESVLVKHQLRILSHSRRRAIDQGTCGRHVGN